MKHPIQPLSQDENGVLRFKQNKIVAYIINWCASKNGIAGFPPVYGGAPDLNQLALMNFPKEDRQQFAQLIGYSLSGYGELSYVDSDAYGVAQLMSEGKSETEARIEHLEIELRELRRSLQKPMARLFGVHPDDLGNNLKD